MNFDLETKEKAMENKKGMKRWKGRKYGKGRKDKGRQRMGEKQTSLVLTMKFLQTVVAGNVARIPFMGWTEAVLAQLMGSSDFCPVSACAMS